MAGMLGPDGRARVYSIAMANDADLDDLARRFLDLWQDQMTALATDEDLARTLQRMAAAMTASAWAAAAGPAAMAAMMAGLPAHTVRERAGHDGKTASGAPAADASGPSGPGAARASGAASAAGASGGGLSDLDDIAGRLAALE
ncbi:MAG: hypothetical protein D6826_06785, partial [Alphaproteobacteria bacterium]